MMGALIAFSQGPIYRAGAPLALLELAKALGAIAQPFAAFSAASRSRSASLARAASSFRDACRELRLLGEAAGPRARALGTPPARQRRRWPPWARARDSASSAIATATATGRAQRRAAVGKALHRIRATEVREGRGRGGG